MSTQAVYLLKDFCSTKRSFLCTSLGTALQKGSRLGFCATGFPMLSDRTLHEVWQGTQPSQAGPSRPTLEKRNAVQVEKRVESREAAT